VLVTHQRQFLPKCDRIAVLRQGCLLACGSWQELLPLQLPELVGGAVTMSLDAAEESVGEDEQQQQDEAQGLSVDRQEAAAGVVGSSQLQQDGSADQVPAAGEELPQVFRAAAAQPIDSAAVVAAAENGVQIKSSGNAEDSGSSGSSGSSGDKSSKFPLSRDRTMAPDVNRRPADSSRPRGSSSSGSWWGGLSLGGSLNPSRSMGRFVRNISRRFGSRSDAAAGKAAAAAAGDVSSDEDVFGDEAVSNRREGLASSFAYAQLAVTRSVQSLFVPPAYLPRGPLYAAGSAAAAAAGADSAAAAVRLQKFDSGKAFGRQDSSRGLASLAPIRSLIVLSHQASLQRGVSMHAAAAAAKLSSSNGDAAAAAAGQLVTAEKRETGSVSWKVYGAYAQQVGVVTSWLMLSALVLGQGVFLAADWWLAMWSASPTGQQLQMK
jgi:hypothetical protein